MSGLSLTNDSIENYLGFLMKLDTNSKKRLIIKLTESIDNKSHASTKKLRSLFGAWEDDRSAEEIIEDIKSTRQL